MSIDNTTGLSSSELEELCIQIGLFSSITSAYIFGSRAKGNYQPGSDVDLALQGESLSRTDIAELSYKLNQESLFPYHFDILNMNTADKKIIEHIKRVGVLILQC
ncbi:MULTISPECIES: nucleotidyltransferase family protein [unclassified Oceanispirochaeta]|uniref:nucleotidyltransferase family protein n=1 Tax=unclassified Oceanispirochaeta TaxID=2635722 RepID=UPI000E0902A2|nr:MULTISPECIES: nucleotidyltransferase domain-containing protein [unclassified Oceanispirochaeta]MBF9018008.1 nucleotidyltransferase domain-containing protein [Oceanispirochaeta sp. M2]NPD74520.1 nucleotidyltransferase domain-containing protein [Oceanispirochaeta sp. M1]RDG29633.1 nucleotidyltransferase domain-containing protein [Oceanispirochaeta sp. M1]